MREGLGDGYTETLRAAYPAMPESADFVMFWWHKAAKETLAGRTRRFGFITTNSIKQTFNRRVVQAAMDEGLYLTFAIPDHPWIDATECAAVRIAMSVGASIKPRPVAQLNTVTREVPHSETGENDVQLTLVLSSIAPDLSTGTDVGGATVLRANGDVCFQGMNLVGEGFRLTRATITDLGYTKGRLPSQIRRYQKGRELLQGGDSGYVIDAYGLTQEQLKAGSPKLYEHLHAHVKPERDHNNRPSRKRNWWLFGETVGRLRKSLQGLQRYIATVETSKHKPFVFVEGDIIPDHKLYAIASDDAFILGVLSARIHGVWALNAGGTLEDRPTWTNTTTFLPFPFPDCTEKQKEKIRKLAEELDAHRKRAQTKHGLGLTDIYNVLEKVRTGEALTAKDKVVHDAALVSTLKQLHDDLDKAVAEAYGWTWPLTDAEILERVVALNAARAAEEAKGNIRWFRPDYQKPLFAGEKQSSLGLEENTPDSKSGGPKKKKSPGKAKKAAWPKSIADRAKAVEAALTAAEHPVTAAGLAQQFSRAKDKEVLEILETLAALGRAHSGDTAGTYVR